MKKLLIILFALLLMMSCALAMEPMQTTYTSGEWEYILLEDGTAEIERYNGRAKTLTVPAELKGYLVTSIGKYAFTTCENLTSVTLPDTVVTLGANPFALCKKLTDINVSPDHPTLATIDGVLFYKPEKRLVCYPYAYTARSYTVPQGVRGIGDFAFSYCNSLTSIMLPDTVTSIGNSAFAMCESLTSITLPDTLTSIGDGAFCGCRSLTSIITLPDTVTSIDRDTFRNCLFLTSITLPDTLTSIGNYAFSNCPNLTFTIPRGTWLTQWCEDRKASYTYLDYPDWLSE